MTPKHCKIWIWIQNNELWKAVYDSEKQLFIVYNGQEMLLFQRKGITPAQFHVIEIIIIQMGAKRLDNKNEPFTYL